MNVERCRINVTPYILINYSVGHLLLQNVHEKFTRHVSNYICNDILRAHPHLQVLRLSCGQVCAWEECIQSGILGVLEIFLRCYARVGCETGADTSQQITHCKKQMQTFRSGMS